MSSNQTFWCHDCDMSIHLLSSATTTTVSSAVSAPPLLCPHCHCPNLELMDYASPTPSTDTTTTSFLDSPSFRRFFLPFSGDFFSSDDEDSDTLLDSILPTIKITSSFLDDDEFLCAVCKEEFVVDAEVKLLPCDHFFHPECILPWLHLNHHSCPLCRFEIPVGSNLGDVSAIEESSSSSSSRMSFSQLGESRGLIECGDEYSNEVDCGFPDVGALSSFLPSHF
ncbi:E3 ubiquitin-protein ligase RNF115 [Euphorbia peplus]|nr:E3 ubiquitin-protein ligase RNF115 [Euphorbia peplus]